MDKAQGLHSSDTDEIDLFQLCSNLWKKRVLIVLCTVSVTLCGVMYASAVPHKFKAEVRIYPSYEIGLPKSNVSVPEVFVNSLENGAFKISFNSEEDKALNLVGQYLDMDSTTAELLQSDNYTDNVVAASSKSPSLAQIRAFNKQVLLRFSQKEEKLDYWDVSLLWDSPDQAVSLLDALVDISITRARKELIEVSRKHHQREINNLGRLIEEKKKVAAHQVEYELDRLRANKALAAEIQLLEQRKEDVVLFDPDVIALNEKRLLLVEENFDSGFVMPARAEPAVVYPVKRATIRIVAISFVFGLVIGVFLALFSVGFSAWKVEKRL